SGTPFLRIETADVSLKHLAVAADALTESPKPKAPPPAAPAAAAKPVAAPAPIPAPAPRAPVAACLQWTPRALKIARDAGHHPAPPTPPRRSPTCPPPASARAYHAPRPPRPSRPPRPPPRPRRQPRPRRLPTSSPTRPSASPASVTPCPQTSVPPARFCNPFP